MNATKSTISGAWEVSDIVNGQYVRRTFYGYTKRDSMRAFRALVLSLKRPRAGAFMERSQPREAGHITTDECRSYGCRECR